MRYAALALLLLACDTQQPADPNAPPTLVDGVEVDTFIVMRRVGGGIHLVDPATGKASPELPAYYSAAFSSVDDAYAISPDGQRIAWVKELGTIAIGEARLVAGEPVLEIVKELPDVTYQGVKWSPDGDRLITTHEVIDVDTWAIHVCPDDDPTTTLPVLNETLVAFPGSHRYICPDGENLYDDGAFVGHAGYGPGLSTADGQLFGLDLHVPSATRRGPEVGSDVLWSRGDLPHLLLPDGKTLIPDGGSGDSAEDGYVYDLPAIYQSRVWARSAPDRWFTREALDPFLHERDARSWQPLALLDNGRAVAYRITHQVWDGFPPELVDADSSVVEVTHDGHSRGFLTSPLVPDESYIRLTDEVTDLAGDDWLLAGWTPKDNGQEPHLVGFVDGEEAHYRGFGTLTPDGRWLYGFRRYTASPTEGGLHCFLDRKAASGPKCFAQVAIGQPIGFMGQGVKPAHAAEPPAIRAVSRTAAWPGAEVVVFGAHFGASGTLTLGGAPVETLSWTPNQIRFRMPSGSAGGVVAVSNERGASGYRDFRVGASALVETPFSRMTTSEVAVGQGINLLALGDVALDDAAFVAVGADYAYLSDGASPARTTDVELHAGGATRTLRMHEEDRSADASRWQIAARELVNADPEPRLEDVGGLLVEATQGRVPQVHGERLVVGQVEQRLYFGGAEERGMPDFWRNLPGGGAWTASRFAENSGAPWSLRLLTGWQDAAPFGWRPVYAETPRVGLPVAYRGVAASGQTVVAVGADQTGGFQLSQDGGQSFTPHDAGTAFALREPILVDAATPFFLVLEADYSALGVKVHALSLDGAFTADVLPALPTASLSHFERPAPFAHATTGAKVALWFGNTHELHLADLDGEPSWTTLTGVRSIHQEGAELYAVMLDGTLRRSTDWKTFAPFDLGIALALPLRVEPLTVSKLAGRWLVLARLYDEDGAPSALTPSAFLLSPPVP